MLKEVALYQFFSGFGLDAYPISNVPAGTEFPYLSYTPVTDSWGGEVSLTVQLWFYTASEVTPAEKVLGISEAIGPGGKILPCDGGAIWLKRGTPWCNPSTGEGDENVKVRTLNVTAEYLTMN